MSTRGPEPMVTEQSLRNEIESTDGPFVTARDISDEMGVARQTAYKHLQRLHERGDLEKRKVGSSAVIWWFGGES